MKITTFKRLPVGAPFEFRRKSKVAGGLYNGRGVKLSPDTYRMRGIRTIGDPKVKVITP